jgi:hypothetical protein
MKKLMRKLRRWLSGGKRKQVKPPAQRKPTPKWADVFRDFEFPKDRSIRDDIREKFGFDGDLLEIFASNTGPVVNKWHHYLPLYDRYFGLFRNRPIRFLEIGVSKGGSLDMWRRYFGPEAVIFGIDIDPHCARFDGVSAQVRIGSQADPDFLRAVVAEMGGIDIVLDDGSHHMDHIGVTLRALFPALNNGGIYMIEDMHTAYFPKFGGGVQAPKNFFLTVSQMVLDMHHWYHGRAVKNPKLAPFVAGLHVHDSMVVIDKAQVHPPTYSRVGTEAEAA